MPEIEAGSVDMVLCDPPYGTVDKIATGVDVMHGMKGKFSWDTIIDHTAMLDQCNRLLRPNGAIVLFCQDPYTAKLMNDTHGNLPFCYRYTWKKDHFANSLNAKKAPVSYTEDVCVFSKRHTKHDFEGCHPLRSYAEKVLRYIGKSSKEMQDALGHGGTVHFLFCAKTTQFSLCTEATYAELQSLFWLSRAEWFRPFAELKAIDTKYRQELISKMVAEHPKTFNLPHGEKYKSNVLEYRKPYTGQHPTQKPVALMEDLAGTYTNPGETVLDFAVGSGTTLVAAKQLGRRAIGIEKEEKYCKIAAGRLRQGVMFGI